MILKAVQTRLEYRESFYISLVSMMFYYVVQFSIVGFTVYSFKEINGWTINEIAFLYSFVLVAQGVNTLVFGPLVRFDELIRKGEWDYLLVRPVHPLLMLLCSKFDPSAMVHFTLGVVFFIFSARNLGVEFTPLNIFLILQGWAGGALVLASVRLVIATIAFYAVSIESLVHFFVYSVKEFILYPINIYKNPIPFLLTFVVPLAFVNFYPVQMFITKQGLFSPFLKYGALPVGILFFTISMVLFSYGNRKYHSTGT